MSRFINYLKHSLALLFLMLCFNHTSIAQDGSTLNKSEPFNLLIPKLEVLIDSAWAKHGLLKFREAEIDVKKANLTTRKRYWTRNFGIQGDSRYGTFANFGESVTNAATVNLSSTTTQFNYGFGVFLKLPVFDIYNRKTEIKQARAEVVAAENFMEFQKFEIKETVIKQYEDLKLKQNLLKLKSKNLANAKVSKRMAENDYKNGLIPIYEYVRLTDITARIESDYETAKSEFFLSKRLLENLTGIIIK